MTTMRTVQYTLHEADGSLTTVVAHYGIRNDRVSIMGEVYYNRDDQTPLANFDPDKCGQVCDDIERAFPWMKPMARSSPPSVVVAQPGTFARHRTC